MLSTNYPDPHWINYKGQRTAYFNSEIERVPTHMGIALHSRQDIYAHDNIGLNNVNDRIHTKIS